MRKNLFLTLFFCMVAFVLPACASSTQDQLDLLSTRVANLEASDATQAVEIENLKVTAEGQTKEIGSFKTEVNSKLDALFAKSMKK